MIIFPLYIMIIIHWKKKSNEIHTGQVVFGLSFEKKSIKKH